jgi:serine/threonine-protein kinase
MLTGTRAFAGDDVSDVLASVLAREPDWTRLPSNLSPALGTYIRRCLEKNPKQRIADAQNMRLALEGAFDSAALPSAPPVATRTASAWMVGAMVVSAVVAGAVVWAVSRPPPPRQPQVLRLQIVTSGTAALTIPRANGQRVMAITPDGSHVVYVGNLGTQLLVRALDSLDPVAVFTGLPRGPFVSPDGQWTAFADGAQLKKVPISGGPPVPIASLDGPTALGATWGPDETIVFATTNGATGLQRVLAAGGTPTVLTRPDVEQGEADHIWPEWLPDGKSVLFTITARNGGLDAAQVAVLDVATGKRKALLRGGSHAHYVPGAPGYLIFATLGTVRAVRFDLERLETRGTPVAVVHDVVTTPQGDMNAVVSADGTLAYVSGTASMPPEGLLTWVDRRGVETPIAAPPRAYSQPRLSPDGKRVAVFTADQDLDIWLSDLGPTLTRLTSGPGVEAFPVWTPDGHRVIFWSQSTSAGNVFWQAADGAGAAERLTESPNAQTPTGISPDGRTLIFTETFAKTGADVMQLALDETRRVSALVQTEFTERNGIISPDGHWLAYESNENSGRFEIFVRPFPDVNRNRYQVSADGGTRPAWARSGRELIYVSPSGAVMAAGVARGPTWASTTPTLVVKEGYMVAPGNPGRTYDISPDGQRFLMIKDRPGSTAPSAGLILVQHWVEELKRLVPMK